jgi:bifunctional non-homologous end joining protein LigD
VLKSWAVPKGPSLDPKVKRLAMQVEDHPVDYAKFEGVIPEGEYGGGTVMVWDYGTYKPEETDDVEAALSKGDFKFTLEGEKFKGSWVLVRTRNRQWLLIKHRDYYTTEEDVTEIAPVSILTRRSLAEIAEDEGGDVRRPRPAIRRRSRAARREAPQERRAAKVGTANKLEGHQLLPQNGHLKELNKPGRQTPSMIRAAEV